MFTDLRGGHNRKVVNRNFFKSWSPGMAYILGMINADGSVQDARKSSRTCYLKFTNTDQSVLEEIRRLLSSNHNIICLRKNTTIIYGKTYRVLPIYNLRIGSKEIVQDLINLNIVPRKTMRLKLPPIPSQLFSYFVRGYFDGDGCIHREIIKNRFVVIFTSGCREFLERLSSKLYEELKLPKYKISFNTRAFRLSYKGGSAKRLLEYMYKDLDHAPYIKKKFDIFNA